MTYRGDGVDGVHDGEQQHVVDAARVVGVAGPGDLLAGGVVDEGRVARDVHLVLRGVGDGAAGAVQVLVLHQGLALLGHHHHEAGGTEGGNADVIGADVRHGALRYTLLGEKMTFFQVQPCCLI